MLVRVARDEASAVVVRLAEGDDLTRLAVALAGDVSAAEGGYVLFESGAAVQRSGADYLISCEWLRAQRPADADWAARLDVALSRRAVRYLPSLDAVSARVIADGPARPVPRA